MTILPEAEQLCPWALNDGGVGNAISIFALLYLSMDASSFNIAKETWSYIAKGFLTESFYRHTEMHTCIAGASGTGWGAGCVDFMSTINKRNNDKKHEHISPKRLSFSDETKHEDMPSKNSLPP